MLSLEKPRLWIVAGPNGSGKSTLYGRTDIKDFGRSVWIINPDILTKHIAEQEHLALDTANRETLNRIQKWLRISVRTYKTVGVETVLSTTKYRTLVRLAKSHGFEIRFLYVTLKTASMNIERVRNRVKEGGHNVLLKRLSSVEKGHSNNCHGFLTKRTSRSSTTTPQKNQSLWARKKMA